ncbi:MAG TPA: pancreas/duodenum homeobox protein 1 [Desulfobulbaceae bacterium]|nr:pancreas/duodenum homeobox protein 1 [Desulfobulbaceae bacterium]
MNTQSLRDIFTDEVLAELFPARRADDFFEALFGDAAEGAFDIRLRFQGFSESASILQFSLDLLERPGCCLVCSLTYGLPEVFSRHPVINIKGLVGDIQSRLGGQAVCTDWKLGRTVQRGKSLHAIPLTITVQAP